jgi:hypothetical protein
MRISPAVPAILIVVFSIGCSQPASPTSAASRESGSPGLTAELVPGAAARSEVPFKGRFEGAYTIAFEPPPSTFFSVNLEASGNATHLGQFTLNAPHRVNSATGTSVGTFEFTAANGDKLTADFTGQSTPTANPGVFAVTETATIVGGTGRFAGAIGGFAVGRLVDLASPLATGSFDGTIDVR